MVYFWAWVMKKSVKGYRKLFESFGMYNSKSGLQMTHDMCINGLFMLLLDNTPDRGKSGSHTTYHENGNIRIELKFNKSLPEAITCLLNLEFNISGIIDFQRTVTADFNNGHCANTV